NAAPPPFFTNRETTCSTTPPSGYVDIELSGGAIDSDEAFPFQMQNDLLGSFLGRQLSCVHGHFGVNWLFVGIRYSGKFLQDAGRAFAVGHMSAALLANFSRRGRGHQEKAATWLDHCPHVLARGIVGRNRRADGNTAVFRDFGGNVANTANVDVAVFLRKTEL